MFAILTCKDLMEEPLTYKMKLKFKPRLINNRQRPLQIVISLSKSSNKVFKNILKEEPSVNVLFMVLTMKKIKKRSLKL
jgi:hypothetical protein